MGKKSKFREIESKIKFNTGIDVSESLFKDFFVVKEGNDFQREFINKKDEEEFSKKYITPIINEELDDNQKKIIITQRKLTNTLKDALIDGVIEEGNPKKRNGFSTSQTGTSKVKLKDNPIKISISPNAYRFNTINIEYELVSRQESKLDWFHEETFTLNIHLENKRNYGIRELNPLIGKIEELFDLFDKKMNEKNSFQSLVPTHNSLSKNMPNFINTKFKKDEEKNCECKPQTNENFKIKRIVVKSICPECKEQKIEESKFQWLKKRENKITNEKPNPKWNNEKVEQLEVQEFKNKEKPEVTAQVSKSETKPYIPPHLRNNKKK